MNEITTLLVGIVLGIGLVCLYIAYRLKALMKRIDGAIEQTLENMFIGVIVEKHESIYRLYSEKDTQFICQGNTVEEIKQAFETAYPNKICYIAGGDDAVVIELEEALKKK